MITHTDGRIHRILPGVLCAALIAVLSVGTPVGAKSYKPGGSGGSGEKAVEHKVTTGGSRSTVSAPSAPSTQSRGGANSSIITSGSYRPGGQSISNYRVGESTYRVGPSYPNRGSVISSGSYKPGSTYKPGTTYKPSYEQYRGPSSISSYKLGGEQYRAPTYKPDYKPAATKPTTVYVRPTPSPRYSYVEPKHYKPPVYKSGRYYYSSGYLSRPCYYGHWTFSYYPDYSRKSCYYHYGIFPYVSISRVVVTSYPQVVYVGEPIYISGGYYLEKSRYEALDEALADIRGAWLGGRFDLIERHVRPCERIAIFLDGRYDYSVEGNDYLQMTHDAVEDLQTSSFVWDNIRKRSDGTVTAFATHRFYESDSYTNTVYVSYTLKKIGSEYYITEVGSSLSPLY